MTVPVAPAQIEQTLEAALKPGASEAATQKLGDKFKAMLEKPRMAAPSNEGGGTSTVAAMAVQQDSELKRTMDDLNTMMASAPNMSMQELTAASMRMTMEEANMRFDMEAKMGVVNSSKSAVETMMKNQ